MGQSLLCVEDRRKTGFKIYDTVFVEILGLFIRYALQSLLGLHHRDSVREAFEVRGKTSLVGAPIKPFCQRLLIRGRKIRISRFFRQVDYGLRTQNAVQVLMQENFG